MAGVSIGESPLVGRGAAVAEVVSTLEAARRSHGALVLVMGPAGIGKTRLAEEVCARRMGFASPGTGVEVLAMARCTRGCAWFARWQLTMRV